MYGEVGSKSFSSMQEGLNIWARFVDSPGIISRTEEEDGDGTGFQSESTIGSTVKLRLRKNTFGHAF